MLTQLQTDRVLAPGDTIPVSVQWSQTCGAAELAEVTRIDNAPGAALRVNTPEQTMAKVEPYLRDYGITRVAHLTYLDRIGIPVHTAHKPNGRSLSNGSGKGVTQNASRVGAIMEAVEQTYWEDMPIERITASQRQLAADGIAHVDPLDIPMNKANLWSPDLVIDWTPMTDLLDRSTVLVPADTVGLPWQVTRRTAQTHMCGSNGLASGSNFLEALLSGLTEVMERDALALMSALTAPYLGSHCLDPQPLREHYGQPFNELMDKLARAELEVSLYDQTGTVGLPTYKCYISEPAQGGNGTFGGYGASLDPTVAMVRAVTEAAQSRCLIIAGARDDQFRCGRDASRLASSHSRVAPAIADIAPAIRQDISTGSITGDLELLLGILRDNGMNQVLVHRYTNETDPVQIVRVVVPQLEGYMFANYARGKRAQEIFDARKREVGRDEA